MKKKLAAVLVIILVALSLVCVVYVISLLQTEPITISEVSNAKITKIEWEGVGYNSGQSYRVRVAVTNYGTNGVNEVTVSARGESDGVSSGNTRSVGLIEAGSTKTTIFSGNYSWLQKIDVFTIMSNGEILDEKHNDFPVMRAEITEIDWDEVGYHRGREYRLHVTVTNHETYEIKGLTVSVREEADDIRAGKTQSVGLIEAGGTKTVIFSSSYSWLQGIDIVTLLFDDEIVDEQHYGFSKWLP